VNIILSTLSLFCLVLIPFSTSIWVDVGLTIAALFSIFGLIVTRKKNSLIYMMILSACPIVPFVKWFEPAFTTQATEAAFLSLNSELDIAENTISQFFLNNASALDSVSILSAQEEDITSEQYHIWLNQVLPPHRNQFLNVALSENLVIKHVYPTIESNNNIVGVFLGDVPDQGVLYKNAAITRQRIVIGPVMLLQGVPGIIYVHPVTGSPTRIISGVLSLEFLKDDLSFVLSGQSNVTIDISTPINNFRLLEGEAQNQEKVLSRSMRFDEIEVDLSISSNEINNIVLKTNNITRLTAFAFWLVLSFILGWQHLNFRIREKQQKALARSESELISAQRLGQMGSWWSEYSNDINLSEPLQQLIQSEKELISSIDLIELLHPSETEIIQKQFNDFVNSDRENLVFEHRIKINGHYRWFEHRIAKTKQHVFSGIIRDIHTLRKRDEQVAQLESFDSLTGAANRHYFKQLTIQNLALCERRRSTLALLLVNIDDFRSINEKHGQLSGDELLKQVTYRLQSASRKSDTIARLSGDTFAISLVDVGKNKQSVIVVEQILRRLKEPYTLSQDIYPQFTMGVAMYPDDGRDYDNVLQMSESALNSAKSNARGHYRFYSAELSEQTDRRQKILASLPSAIRNNFLHLVFQPRVSVSDSTGEVSAKSMEALVRWQDPELGFVSPGEFIPIAEQTTLISDIGQWVMENVFAMMAENKDHLPKDLTVSINLSPRQLEDPMLVATVKEAIEKYGVRASQFELEITEYSISEESESIINNMLELSEMGFKFALDDFGTGYSNLGMLQSLPLNVLKVDMMFIRAIGTTLKSDELVRAILNIGHTLGLKVVAEGVESAEQVQFLKDINCDELQGFYFFKPTLIDELIPKIN